MCTILLCNIVMKHQTKESYHAKKQEEGKICGCQDPSRPPAVLSEIAAKSNCEIAS